MYLQCDIDRILKKDHKQIEAYIKANGWEAVSHLFNSFIFRQINAILYLKGNIKLLLPVDKKLADYSQRIVDAINKIRESEQISLEELLNKI